MTDKKTKKIESKPTFTRLRPDVVKGLDKMAAHYRVTVSDLLRWAAEDLVAGKYLPDNLAKPV